MAPTLREMDISLSFRMTAIWVCVWPMWFKASKAMPPDSAASPMIAATFSWLPRRSRAIAQPSATESELDA